MKHFNGAKRVITMIKVVMMLVCTFCATAPALPSQEVQAALSFPSVSASAYCEFKAAGTIYVFKDANCNTRGTASPNKTYNASPNCLTRMSTCSRIIPLPW